MLKTKKIFSVLLLFVAMLLLKTPQLIAQQPYGIIEVGNGITPTDLNDNNDVVGQIGNSPVLWKNGVVVPLQTINNGNGIAYGINNSGEISGRVSVVTGGGQTTATAKWNSSGNLIFTDNVHDISFGIKLNDNGSIGGTSAIVGGPSRATIWINNNPFYINLPASNTEGGCWTQVWDINNNNWAVGSACLPGDVKSFVWKSSGNMVYLPDLGQLSYANGISNNNLIVGNVQEPITFFRKAAYWANEILNIIETPAGFNFAEAMDVNSSNEIVGYYRQNAVNSFGFIFKDGVRTDLNALLPVNSGWSITKAVAINENGAILAVGIKNGNASSCILTPKRYPVFIVPGIAGTYSESVDYDLGWLIFRGVTPNALQIDPLGKVYHDLIKTFENVGYEQGKDLYVVNYDWRLTPGPIDNIINGHISGLSGISISDNQFDYGVDYLGWYIKQACEKWRQDYNEELDSIDVISHSTGGLVTRTYIQSDAYGAVYDNVNSYKLPKIRNFIMIGVPNRGASKAWNPLHDNWIADKAYKFVLSKIINRVYQKVKQGAIITGPDYDITLASITGTNNKSDSVLFIKKYVPTIRYLLATYDFIDFGAGFTNVNNDLEQRNTFVLDLNDGLDLTPSNNPNRFLDSAKVTVIYGTGEPTAVLVAKRTDSELLALQPFANWTPVNVTAGTIWYEDLSGNNNGDKTVPVISSVGQFLGDNRANLVPFNSGDHTELVSMANVQSTMLNILGISYNEKNISTGSSEDYSNVLQVISDPVNLFVTDGSGMRLGYSDSTGAITEIPGSSWYGDTNGMGYIFGSVQQPINLQLIGLGQDYYVMVSIEDSTASGGVVLEGFLATGEIVNYQITLDPVSVEQINSAIPQDFALEQNYPNPFNPTTTIKYSIPEVSYVELIVFDILGKEVATLVNEEKPAGNYSVDLYATKFASGIYFYKLQAGTFFQTKKMILIK